MDSQTIVEAALQETLYRHIYRGEQLYTELSRLSECIDINNTAARDFVDTWIMSIEKDEIYRKSVVQNNLIDLHDKIVNSLKSDEPLIVSPIS